MSTNSMEGKLAFAMGSLAAVTTGYLRSTRIGPEGTDAQENGWHYILGQLSGYSNVWFRRAVQVLITIKLVFLFMLEASTFGGWNSAILFCIGWHIYCLVASEILVISITKCSLVGVPCRQLLALGVLNVALFLVYLLLFWSMMPNVHQLSNEQLPVGIIIQTFPFPPSSPFALWWAILLALVRLPMTLVWSMGLYLLSSKVFYAVNVPDAHQYNPPASMPMVLNETSTKIIAISSSQAEENTIHTNPAAISSEANVLSQGRKSSAGYNNNSSNSNHQKRSSAPFLSPRAFWGGGNAAPFRGDRTSSVSGDRRRRGSHASVSEALNTTFMTPVASTELKYRFRHFCHLVEELKRVSSEVQWLSTCIFTGQMGLAVLALNCLVLGAPTQMSPFITTYVTIMIGYVLYMVYAFSSLVSSISIMRNNFLSIIDQDLLTLDMESQMECMRDNLQIRQVVIEMELGLSIFGGAFNVDTAIIIRMFGLLASVFFVLVNIKSRNQ